MAIIVINSLSIPVRATPLALADKPLFISAGYLPNVLVILDNSNSMDEAANGSAVGSAAPDSKSEIARGVIKDLTTVYNGQINLGLMAYQQENVVARQLHNSPYDASFDPAHYDPDYTGNRDSIIKKYRVPNLSNPGAFVYYNVALPFYASANYGSAYCYSSTADFDNGTEVPGVGPWDTYACYRTKSNTSDEEPITGFSNFWFNSQFLPTDSDYAQNILDFGKFLTWDYISPTWFSNTSPGRGFLHVPLAKLDSTQASKLNTKLAVSQFTTNAPTNSAYPLQNAGLTPLEGTLYTARDYFAGNLSQADEGYTSSCYPLPESCGYNSVILVTDGLPSVDQNGALISNEDVAIANVATAAGALADNDIKTYVVGFALPYGVSADKLDLIAAAGGTTSAFSANDSTTLQVALKAIFETISLESSSAAAGTANTSTLVEGSKLFQAKFNSNEWSGDLLSYPINTDNGTLDSPTSFAGVLDSQNWDTGRDIITYNPDAVDSDGNADPKGVPFRWSELSLVQQGYLNDNIASAAIDDDGNGYKRLEYIRGSDAYDGTEHASGSDSYTIRTRASKLGDIIHSAPYFVAEPSNTYPSNLESVAYSNFREVYANRAPMVYVGSNDGMLHAFRAETVGSSPVGTELFAYVPNEVIKNLNQLTDSNYTLDNNKHTYFVDGAPVVGDAFFNSAWHTVLISGLNGGGQSMFALDVTDPDNFAEDNAANMVLWEFTDADLGFTYSQAAIVKMNNGKWVAVFGNGYNNTQTDGSVSSTGHAYLYIVDIETGDIIKKIDTGVGSTATPNGLATPAPIDTNGDNLVDYIYAGDLRGNLWKFDVTATTATQWKVAYLSGTTPLPIFTALDDDGNALPITMRPEVGSHPAESGYMVYFGTGKYLETDDNVLPNPDSTTDNNMFFGIWDKNDSTLTAFTKSDLLQQEIIFESSSDINELDTTNSEEVYTYDIRVVSNKEINWSSHMGWMLELPTNGERIVENSELRNGNIIFTTLIPSLNSCEAGGTSWLMELNSKDGSRIEVFDLNGDGKYDDDYMTITVTDENGVEQELSVPVSGKKSKSGILSSPAIVSKDDKEFKYSSGSKGDIEVTIEKGATENKGRVSWQQLQ